MTKDPRLSRHRPRRRSGGASWPAASPPSSPSPSCSAAARASAGLARPSASSLHVCGRAPTPRPTPVAERHPPSTASAPCPSRCCGRCGGTTGVTHGRCGCWLVGNACQCERSQCLAVSGTTQTIARTTAPSNHQIDLPFGAPLCLSPHVQRRGYFRTCACSSTHAARLRNRPCERDR